MKTEQKSRKPVASPAVTRGSRNVFADLGFPQGQAADLKIKAELTLRIYRQIKELGLTQVKAAEKLGLSQPDVSKLMNGQYTGYSVDRLLMLLNALEMDVDIIIRPKRRSRHALPGVVRILEPQLA